jgi:hypothetical protein
MFLSDRGIQLRIREIGLDERCNVYCDTSYQLSVNSSASILLAYGISISDSNSKSVVN